MLAIELVRCTGWHERGSPCPRPCAVRRQAQQARRQNYTLRASDSPPPRSSTCSAPPVPHTALLGGMLVYEEMLFNNGARRTRLGALLTESVLRCLLSKRRVCERLPQAKQPCSTERCRSQQGRW